MSLPASTDSWDPFVFVNLEAGARPLAHYLGDLPSIIAGSGLALG